MAKRGMCEFCGAVGTVINVVMGMRRSWMCPSCERETRKWITVERTSESHKLSDFASKLTKALGR